MTGYPGPDGDFDPATFGNLLYRHRRAAGQTQEELAEAAGVSVRTVRNLELGQVQRPRRTTILELADALRLAERDREHLLRSARPPAEPAVRFGCLPPDVGDFAGRQAVLTELCRQLTPGAVVVVHGPPGVGKTSLLVHTAHRLGTDAVYFLDLRGMDDPPVSLDDALGQLLTALGEPVNEVPGSSGARLARYRMLTAQRGGVLILDNAATEAQIRPLLPTGSDWRVLVSSRQALTGLAGVRRVRLEVLDPTEANDLIAEIVGADRVAAEPQAAAELAELCGFLPLALRVAGNRLAVRPGWPIAGFATQLRDERRRLDLLRAGDIAVRSAFTVSYRQLPDQAQRLLRRMSLLGWSQYRPDAAARLLDASYDAAADLLDVLVDAGLLNPGPAAETYLLHDLTALFAAERAVEEETAESRREAQDRVAEALLTTVSAVGTWLNPDLEAPGALFRDGIAALAWCTDHRHEWWWAIRHMSVTGRHSAVLSASRDLYWYSDRYHAAAPWAQLFELGITAAVALGDPVGEAGQRNSLGWALSLLLGQPDEAAEQHRMALALAERATDARQIGWSNVFLGAAMGYDHRRASIEHYTRGRSVFDSVGYRIGRVIATYSLANALRSIGEPAEAVTLLSEAADDWRGHTGSALTGASIAGWIEVRLSGALADLGRWREAIAAGERSLLDFQIGADPSGGAEALLHLGDVLTRAGDPRARQVVEDAAQQFERMNDQRRVARVEELRKVLESSLESGIEADDTGPNAESSLESGPATGASQMEES